MKKNLEGMKIGFAMTGSFCSFETAIKQVENLISKGALIIPIMSYNAYNTDTRFGKAVHYINKIETICDREVIHTITDAEPIGPMKMLDILLVCPCTGNTLAKLAGSITDTAVV